MTEEEGHNIVQKVTDVIEFLTEEEIKGALWGTLIYLELSMPGYTDTLVLNILSARAGMVTKPDWADDE